MCPKEVVVDVFLNVFFQHVDLYFNRSTISVLYFSTPSALFCTTFMCIYHCADAFSKKKSDYENGTEKC